MWIDTFREDLVENLLINYSFEKLHVALYVFDSVKRTDSELILWESNYSLHVVLYVFDSVKITGLSESFPLE